MPQSIPSWKPVAFKEWQVVCDAIAAGKQSVILRKGGISEGKHGFQWLHDRFFLFPTLFHEQNRLVRPQAGGDHREFPVGADDEDRLLPLTLYVETLATGRLTDWEEICELESFHIWTRQCIRERFDWGEEPGISYAVIRAARLPEPWLLANRPAFGGCRSWVGLPAEENGGFVARLASAEWIHPVCGFPQGR